MSDSVEIRISKKFATPFLVALVVWNLINACIAFGGLLDGGFNVQAGPMRRIEILFPGYRLARWVMRPIHGVKP